MQDIVLSTIYELIPSWLHVILKIQEEAIGYYFNFTDEKTEEQRATFNC